MPINKSKKAGTPISVVIPTYNRAHMVTRAIDSALKAISTGDEVIVCDDGSTDGTDKILKKYGRTIRFIRAENQGAGAARNLGIRTAKHDWIAFLDSDDEWISDHLDLHRAFLESSDVLFSFSNFDVFYDEMHWREPGRMRLVSWTKDPRSWDEILGQGVPYSRFAKLPVGRNDFKVHTGELYPEMLRTPYVPAWTSLVRRDAVGMNLWFPEDLPTFEDVDYYIRLSRLGNAAYLDCATAINHGHSGYRLTGADELTVETTWIKVLERNWGSDPEFLKQNRLVYEAMLNERKIRRIRQLVIKGYTNDARQELEGIVAPPLSVRILSVFPGFLSRFVCKIYLSARRVFS